MSPSEKATGGIRVTGASPFTEIRILDASLATVPMTSNSGNVEVALSPGLYEVGFRHGEAWRNAHVLLSPGQDMVEVAAPELSSPVRWTEAPDIVAARQADAATVVVELEEEGRDLFAKEDADQLEVVLVSLDGEVTRPFYGEALVPGTWRFFVHPGHWRLRLNDRSAAPAFELPVTVCPGWSVHIACATTRLPSGTDPEQLVIAIDLERLNVRMLGGDNASGELTRDQLACEEASFSALASGRSLQGADFEALLRRASVDLDHPTAAICAAHLLAAGPGISSPVLDEVLERLEDVTSRHPTEPFPLDCLSHPDVTCLKLRIRLARGQPINDLPPVPFPPSLLAGWKALLEGARIRPELVPLGSPSARIAGEIWSASTWVAWTADALDGKRAEPAIIAGPTRSLAEMPATAPPRNFDTARQLIVAGLSHAPLRQWLRETRDRLLDPATPNPSLSKEMLAIASALRPVPSEEQSETLALQAALVVRPGGGPQDLAALCDLTGLPPCTAAEAAEALAQRLVEEAHQAGFDLERRIPMARPDLIIPYDPHFLGDGFVVPLPSLSDAARAHAFADGAVIDYCHYSLVMRQDRRIALYTANNIDAARKVSISGGLTWQMDERVGEYQIGRETYDRNQIDKGHLVRREDVLWGTIAEARAANKATYFYTNAAPQHQNFNQDEWKCLEDWVLRRATDLSYRLCVFTGPVLTDRDPTLEDLPPDLRTLRSWGPAQLPAAFWKVIVLRDAEAGGSDLSAIAFAMKQGDMWTDRQGKKLLDLRVHQVTLKAIEEWTGLDFGPLRDVDELAFSPLRGIAEDDTWPTVGRAEDISWSGAERRARGLGAVRAAQGSSPARTLPAGTATHECCHDGFDPKAAIEALSRDVARLTNVVARQAETVLAAPGPRSIEGGGDDPRLAPADDGRVEAIAAASSDEARETVRAFARLLVGQSDIARGLRPVPEARELERIVGGEEVSPGGFPHCVCIGTPDQWMCTGVLVAPRVVLTAAHCGGAIDRIAIGTQVTPGLSPDTRTVAVQRVAIHPGYRRHPVSENDITVLILAAPAMAAPARLAREADILASANVHLVGFGHNDPQQPRGFGRKRQVSIDLPPIIRGGQYGDTARLESLLGFHGEYEFVAGRKALGRDSCNGDSGGPAYIRVGGDYRVAGLTSRATREAVRNCGDGGIYVRPDHFRAWIDEIVAAGGLPPLNW